jgi:hypothetical protein
LNGLNVVHSCSRFAGRFRRSANAGRHGRNARPRHIGRNCATSITVHHCRHGTAMPQMADDESHFSALPLGVEHLHGAARTVGMAQPVEAITSDAPIARPTYRQRIGVRFRRQRGVKCGIEHRDVRHIPQHRFRGAQRFQARRIMERRQVRQLHDARANLRRDTHRRRERPAMHHAMSDGRQAGALRFRQIGDEAFHRFGVAAPGDVFLVLMSIRAGLLIARRRSCPVGQTVRKHRTIRRFHQDGFQAARTRIEQQDVHAASSSRRDHGLRRRNHGNRAPSGRARAVRHWRAGYRSCGAVRVARVQ